MSQYKSHEESSNVIGSIAKSASATPYKRKYGLAKLLAEVDPDFLAPGELEKATADHERLSQLFEGIKIVKDPFYRDFVVGTVVAQSNEGLFVSNGRKYDAFVPHSEAAGLTVGEEGEFLVTSALRDGMLALSATTARGWRKLEELQGSDEILQVRVFKEAIDRRSKKSSGLRVIFESGDMKGIQGFIPNTLIARTSNKIEMIGTLIDVVVDIAEAERGDYGNLVVSHRGAKQVADDFAFATIQLHSVVTGKIFDFIKANPKDLKLSALVQLENGLVCLLHRSETISSEDCLEQMYAKGDEITACVSQVNEEQKRVALSLKKLAKMQRLARLRPNDIIEAQILRKELYGYFASIGGGMQGLIHESDLVHVNGRPEIFKLGDMTEVLVLSYEPDGARVALGRRQLHEHNSNAAN